MNIKLKFKKEISDETMNLLKKNDLITVKQYAQKHNKSEWTVQRMCHEGILPSRKIANLWVIKDK